MFFTNFAVMMDDLRKQFVFTTDTAEAFEVMQQGYCMHMVCTQGAMQVKASNQRINVIAGDAVIIANNMEVSDLSLSPDMTMRCLLISMGYLAANRPQTEYSVVGMLSTMKNPVFPMHAEDASLILHDFDEIELRLSRPYHSYYADTLRRCVENMILDFYDIHGRHSRTPVGGLSQSRVLLQRFIELLHNELFLREREVRYYADLLYVTPGYLSEACVAASGHNASYWIAYYTVNYLRQMLDSKASLTDIMYKMNFPSLSYLTRYTRKHLGMTPSEYRKRGK